MPPADPLLPGVDLGDIALRLLAAVIVGVVIGMDREVRGKPVGIRTLALVSLGSALVCLSTVHLTVLQNQPDAVSRVVQGVIQGVMPGIGFIGAGVVLHRHGGVRGLTTAATVWVTAALGIACALAAWEIVLMGVGLTLVVLVALLPVEDVLDKRRAKLKGAAAADDSEID